MQCSYIFHLSTVTDDISQHANRKKIYLSQAGQIISFIKTCYKGQHCGIMSKASDFDAGIPRGHWFMSQLLCFQSISWLMAWEMQPRMAQLLWPLPPTWETWGVLLAPGSSWPGSGPMPPSRE